MDDKDNPDPSFDISKVSQELANHLNAYENSAEVMNDIRNTIETTTVQMEDTKRSLEQVRSDADTRSEVASKELYEAAHHLDALYDKIDALERFVNIVKGSVNEVADRVEEAESFLTSPINRVLDTIRLNTAKSVGPDDLSLPPMKPLNIYCTSDYFPSSSNE
ncbi:12762_t:CDS:2 [Funneliformis mosseae]|uniref:12762_t:CDS:1 n=1 Tax=Funneliformis mosseae TaxID=27381 RepID=A0A9N8WCS0_FUNMO|nr:12762_t:CDS:2 [Funneliformis mosseae]